MKYACICGWIGKEENRATHGEAKVCPRCLHCHMIPRSVFRIIPCPRCGNTNQVALVGDNMYSCGACGPPHFDNDPEEGAAGCYNDPTKTAEKKEEREQSRRQRNRLPRHRF